MPILEAKLTPPAASDCLPRPRLFERLDQLLHRPLITLFAEGGSGKSTLLASYLDARGIAHVWYNLDPIDQSAAMFTHHLLAGLERAAPAAADRIALLRIAAGTGSAAGRVLYEAVAVAAATCPRLCLVLDDFHRVQAGAGTAALIDELLSYLPPTAHLVIVGRGIPNLPLVRYKLEGKMSQLGKAELAFTRDEVRELFVRVYGADLTEGELDVLLEKTEGWPASLPLVYEVWKDLDAEARAQFWRDLAGAEEIFAYLAMEVLEGLPADVQAFLHRTSLLYVVEPQLAGRLLRITHAREILDRLHASHLFTTPVDRARRAYRYHPLLQELLQRRLRDEVGDDGVAALHGRIGDLYACERRYDYALVHYVAGRAFDQAARVARDLVSAGGTERWVPLERWVERLHPDLPLFLRRAIPLGALEEITEDLNRVLAEAEARGQTIDAAHIRLRLAYIHMSKGRTDEALAFTGAALAAAQQRRHGGLLAVALNLKAQVHWYLGEVDAATECCQRALAAVRADRLPTVQLQTYWLLAEFAGERAAAEPGDGARAALEAGLRWAEAALAVQGLGDDPARVFPLCVRARLLAVHGDIEAALRFAGEAVAMAERFRIPVDLGWAWREHGLLQLRLGQLEAAREELLRAVDYLQPHTLLLAVARVALAEVQRRLGNSEQAAALLAEVQSLEGAAIRRLVAQGLKQYPGLAALAAAAPGSVGVPAGAAPVRITIRALGPLEVLVADQPVAESCWRRGDARRLLLYLLSCDNLRAPRRALVAALWPDQGEAAAHNRLHVALSTLRRVLEPDLPPRRPPRYLQRDGEGYRLCLPAGAYDVQQFLEQAGRVDHRGDGPLPAAERAAAAHALACYRGEFLQDFEEEFLLPRREQLAALHLALLLRLARHHRAAGQIAEALDLLRQALALEPYREQLHREVIRCHLEAGDRAAAALAYQRCTALLRAELDVEPGPETVALWRTVGGLP